MPDVILVHMHVALGSQKMERRQPEIIERLYLPAVPAVCIYIALCKAESFFVIL